MWIGDKSSPLKKFLEKGFEYAKKEGHGILTPWHYLFLNFDSKPPKNAVQIKLLEILKNNLAILPPSSEIPKTHFTILNVLSKEPKPKSEEEFINQLYRYALPLSNPWEWGIDWVPIFEVDRIFSSLNSTVYNGILLVGRPGIGKSHFIHHLKKTISGDYISLRSEYFISLFTLKDNALKEFQKQIEEAIKKRIPLIIEDLENLNGTCTYDIGKDLISFLESFFHFKNFTFIGTTVPEFANNRLRINPLWNKNIDFFYLKVPSEESLKNIVLNHIKFLNDFFGENYFFPLMQKSIEEGPKYFSNLSSPGCNVSYLWETAQNFNPNEKKWVETQAEEHFSIYVEKVYKPEVNKLEKFLKSKIFGQDEAIKKIINRLKITRAKMDSYPLRPDGVFLLLGPSGVGKTETARVVSEWLNGTNVPILKFDMSEFMESNSISKFIGSPPGYVGYDEGSVLVKYLSGTSDRVILLDEIEKAHPQVLNLFLQVFDEGILTDSQGIKISFSNSIFFLTSNLGHLLWETEWKKQVGFIEGKQKKSEDKIRDTLMGYMPIEFLNRIDEIILYNPLKTDDLKSIAKCQLELAKQKFLSRFEIDIIWDEEYIDWLIKKDCEPAFGARHIIRNIEKYIFQKILNDFYEKKVKENEKYYLKPLD